MLLFAGGVNLLIAFVLLYNNVWFRNYDVYRRARQLVALCYVIFAIGFFLHDHFEWRTSCPAAASALSVSYFHIGGVLLGWSHTSLLRPDYLSKKVIVRDLLILAVGLIAYWTVALAQSSTLNPQRSTLNPQFSIFFLHATFIAYTFYHTYFTVRRNIMRMPANDGAPSWWTPEAKRTVLSGHHSFMVSGHLIVLFGIGSIIVTAVFPTQITPYTVLLCMGIIVYCYIFYALTEYGNVIEAATCATEDVTKAFFDFQSSTLTPTTYRVNESQTINNKKQDETKNKD